MSALKIACRGAFTLPLHEMHEFQGDLKDLLKEDYEKLRRSLQEDGYAFASTVWKNPEDGLWYLCDGHQRKRVMTEMEEEGWDIPELPVVETFADSYEQAKKLVLSASSLAGTMTQEGLYQFIIESKLDPKVVAANYRFPHVKMVRFQTAYFGDTNIIAPTVVRTKKCPHCGEQIS